MTSGLRLFDFIPGLAMFLLAAASSAALTKQANTILLSSAPAPALGFDEPLSPQYFPLSQESESPAADSPETEPETGSSGSESSPVFSPVPEAEPADLPTSTPSTLLPLPSMAPITGEDNDADPINEATAWPPTLTQDQSNGDSTEEASENYSQKDNYGDASSLEHQGKDRTGAIFGVMVGICLVGLGGFVYLKTRSNGVRRSKYNQYVDLNKKEGV